MIYLDPLFFLEGLLYGEDLIFWFKVEGLLTACESFDKDLIIFRDVGYKEREAVRRKWVEDG